MLDKDFSDGLIFSRVDGGRLKIGMSAYDMMRRYIQDKPGMPEAGGILLGRYIIDAHDVVIDRVTVPLPGDRRSRFRFTRCDKEHQRIADRAWNRSHRTCTYLGEWHTHPEAVPHPSGVDQNDWRRKLREDRYAESLFFIIVGINEVRIWEGKPGIQPTLLYRI
jgi:integrative and conjugative element protein (TIGR02256 family)